MKKHLFLLPLIFLIQCGSNPGGQEMNSNTNELIHESSPYLLQHAYNPVNWYPWGDKALDKAKEENKLIVISIGYSSCHWCHVMEHESFEDSLVAAVMNEHFVSVKVDREERPDVDQIYMDACQLLNQSGGWPLNAIALPDGRPIYAGTYYKKEDWIKLLEYFVDIYENQPELAEKQAEDITNGIRNMEFVQRDSSEYSYSKKDMEAILDTWKSSFDKKWGGRKGAPKFPMPNNYQYLLKHSYHLNDLDAFDFTHTTLEEMAKGGIYDHLRGGFARYSVDAEWLVPHFEKMLYDNGQLLSLYATGYQTSPNPLYKQIVEETVGWMRAEMLAENGGFYSSLDADSEGEEGKFYVWTSEEIDEVLGEDADFFKSYYGITKSGNWEHGKNILHTSHIKDKEFVDAEIQTKLLGLREKLLEKRNERVRPGLDDKILTSWNAIALKGMIDAYRVFNKVEYIEIAEKNAIFLRENAIHDDFRLTRNYKDGKASINAFLDDYALLIDAYIAMYQATFEEEWLHLANNLTNHAIEHFYDDETGMFFYTSDLDKDLIARKQETSDNVIPASNSVMANNLFVLGHYFYNEEYLEMSKQMLDNVREQVIGYPTYYSNWAILLSHMVYSPFEVAIVGEDHNEMNQRFNDQYLPDVLFLGGRDEGTLQLLEFKLIDGQTTIYVCQNKACKLPVTDVDEAIELLKR